MKTCDDGSLVPSYTHKYGRLNTEVFPLSQRLAETPLEFWEAIKDARVAGKSIRSNDSGNHRIIGCNILSAEGADAYIGAPLFVFREFPPEVAQLFGPHHEYVREAMKTPVGRHKLFDRDLGEWGSGPGEKSRCG